MTFLILHYSKARGRRCPNVINMSDEMYFFLISSLFSVSVLSQSTMVVLQALSEYLINKPPPDDLSLDVDVRITGRKEIRYHFNPQTAYAARSSRVRDVSRQEAVGEYQDVSHLMCIFRCIFSDLFLPKMSSSLLLLFLSCPLILIWKWRLGGMDREYWRYDHVFS